MLKPWEEKEKQKFVRFEYDSKNDRFVAYVCNSEGEHVDGGNLFILSDSGLELFTSISEDFGFSLTDEGRLKVHNL